MYNGKKITDVLKLCLIYFLLVLHYKVSFYMNNYFKAFKFVLLQIQSLALKKDVITYYKVCFLLRLEIENARLEATTKQQTIRIEVLQKDLQESVSVSQLQV